jgi:hypothetical protein
LDSPKTPLVAFTARPCLPVNLRIIQTIAQKRKSAKAVEKNFRANLDKFRQQKRNLRNSQKFRQERNIYRKCIAIKI